MSRTPGAKDKRPRKIRPDAKTPKGIIADNHPDLPDGYNTKMIQFMMEIMPTEKLDVWDVDEMERRFLNYLRVCAERDVKVGNQAAYFAIGIDKDTVRDWIQQDPNMRNQRTRFVKKVKQICGMTRENLMQDGKINPVTGIFWQKNYDGLKDQTETIITPNNPLGDATDSDTLRLRYLSQKEQPLIEAENAENAEMPQKGAERELVEIQADKDPTGKILEFHSDPDSEDLVGSPD